MPSGPSVRPQDRYLVSIDHRVGLSEVALATLGSLAEFGINTRIAIPERAPPISVIVPGTLIADRMAVRSPIMPVW